ncbi:MAG TPA: hypothetical protein PLX10_01415 [Candidatus Paceibacterota bacterium]|mgnify:CR=1 FL=1|nr:hypothetical protein [Candidatus Paceibacterota bacterium]
MPAIAYRIGSNQNFYDSANTGLSVLYFKSVKKTKRLLGSVSLLTFVPILVLSLFLAPYIALRCQTINLDSDIKVLKKSLSSLTEDNSSLENIVFNDISLAQVSNWAQANHFVEVNDFYPLALNHASNVALTE